MYINQTHNLWKFGEAMCYQTEMSLIFFMYFSDIGHCFCSAQTKSLKNQKSDHVRMILDNIPYFYTNPYSSEDTRKLHYNQATLRLHFLIGIRFGYATNLHWKSISYFNEDTKPRGYARIGYIWIMQLCLKGDHVLRLEKVLPDSSLI